MTTIAYVGNFVPERSTENAYRYAFEQLGVTVLPIQQEFAHAKGPAAITDIDGGKRDIDVVLYTRSHNRSALIGPEWTDTWRELEVEGIATASVHLDVFVGPPDLSRPDHDTNGHHLMNRHGLTWRDPLFTTGHVFTPDPLLANYISTADTNHIYLQPAADIRQGDPLGEPIQGLSGKVAFVGSLYGVNGRHPEYPERAGFLAWLKNTYGDDFYWYGPGSPLGTVRGKSLWDIYASDCVIVGDSCFAQSIEGRPYYWSDRVPETVGHGGLLVHPVVAGLREFYPSTVTWHSGSDDPAEAIAEARAMLPATQHRGEGRAVVLRNHTYVHRAALILQALGLKP